MLLPDGLFESNRVVISRTAGILLIFYLHSINTSITHRIIVQISLQYGNQDTW